MIATCLKLIRKSRNEKRYSQKLMATKLHFTQSYYTKVECGKAKISAELLFRILEVLELDYADFFKKVKKQRLEDSLILRESITANNHHSKADKDVRRSKSAALNKKMNSATFRA